MLRNGEHGSLLLSLQSFDDLIAISLCKLHVGHITSDRVAGGVIFSPLRNQTVYLHKKNDHTRWKKNIKCQGQTISEWLTGTVLPKHISDTGQKYVALNDKHHRFSDTFGSRIILLQQSITE